MEILKPCPFCGGKVSIEMLDSEQQRNIKIYYAIHCPECWFWMFKGLSREKVIERWNKRTELF
jgi:Lar family restriction alleviation protein